MKRTPKSCSCRGCRYGKGTTPGHHIMNQGDRKLRKESKKTLDTAVKSGELEVVISPASHTNYIS